MGERVGASRVRGQFMAPMRVRILEVEATQDANCFVQAEILTRLWRLPYDARQTTQGNQDSGCSHETRLGSSPEHKGVCGVGGRFLLRGAGVVSPAWFSSRPGKGILGRFCALAQNSKQLEVSAQSWSRGQKRKRPSRVRAKSCKGFPPMAPSRRQYSR